MLKYALYTAIGLAGLFILCCLALAVLMLLVILTTRDSTKVESGPPVRRGRSDVAPVHDDELFRKLASEAQAYAARPYVTTIVDVIGAFLLSTVSDPYGKRVYAESRRRIGKSLSVVLCLYEDGAHVPSVAVATDIPASRVEWSEYFAAVKDVQADGPHVSFTDHVGRRRQARIPIERRHHA